MKYAKITSWGTEYDVVFDIVNENPLNITLMCKDEEDGRLEPYCGVTIRGIGDDKTAAVKNYSENEGLDKWLSENGFAEYTGSYAGVGYATVPVMKFNMEKIREYSLGRSIPA